MWPRKCHACPGNEADLYTDLALSQYGPDTQVLSLKSNMIQLVKRTEHKTLVNAQPDSHMTPYPTLTFP